MREGNITLAKTAADPEIEVIECGGFKIENYFAGTGDGCRGILVFQYFPAAEGVEPNCLHGGGLSFRREFPVLRGAPEAGERQLAHEDKFLGELVVELREEFLVREKLLLPLLAVQ